MLKALSTLNIQHLTFLVPSWSTSSVNCFAALLPVGEAVLVHINVVELDSPELLRQHVRVFAVPAGTVDDDRQILVPGIAALREQLIYFLVDVRFPHRKWPRAG